jgi:hypothetical protein
LVQGVKNDLVAFSGVVVVVVVVAVVENSSSEDSRYCSFRQRLQVTRAGVQAVQAEEGFRQQEILSRVGIGHVVFGSRTLVVGVDACSACEKLRRSPLVSVGGSNGRASDASGCLHGTQEVHTGKLAVGPVYLFHVVVCVLQL